MEDTKICPYCGEEIKAVAKKCRFCGQWLDEEANETAPVQEDVKTETEPPIEKPASKEADDKPRIEANRKGAESSNKSTVYWIVGLLAAVLLIGVGFLLGNNGSDSSSEQPTAIEESDPEAKLKAYVETLYAEVFSSPESNCESRYLSTDFYNTYVQARDIAIADGASLEWKNIIWCHGKEWRKMSVKVNDISFLPGDHASANLELTDDYGNTIKSVTLHMEKASGDCRITDISYSGQSVKQGLQEYVSRHSQSTSDPYDASNDVYDYWQGSMKIEGLIYRYCNSLVRLSLEKNGDNNYKGDIWIGLGDYLDDNSGKFDYWAGELTGKVRARATGNQLLVTLVSYTSGPGERDNYFTREYATFQSNSQIFLITKNGSKYEAKPVGKMENILDETGEIYVTK